MSSESAKKRQRRGHPGITMTDMNMEALFDQRLSQMEQRMQSKIDSMKGDMDAMKDRHSRRVDKMEKRCKYLEGKCVSMGRSLKALARRWEYSAPDTPASHWTNQGSDDDSSSTESVSGFDEDYFSDVVEPFIDNIKGAVSKLKEGDTNLPRIGREDGRVVLHHDALLPHWQNLADALHIYGPLSVEEEDDEKLPIWSARFWLEGVQLSWPVIGILAPALSELKGITSVILDDNEFERPRDGINFAARLLRNNYSVYEFVWANNSFATEDEADALAGAITSCPSIRRIHINYCCESNTDAGYHLLTSLLSRINALTFESDPEREIWIDLGGNSIRGEGQAHLSDCLAATNPVLRRLDLDNNSLDDNDAILIADALRRNATLECISLAGNDITEIGEIALRKALFDETSLNAAADSNHTCYIEGIAGACYGNRSQKIYLLLSSRNENESNAHHLELELGDDSLGLIPRVLECVHSCAVENIRQVDFELPVPPLAIFFELLRSWKMPSLYQNGRCG